MPEIRWIEILKDGLWFWRWKSQEFDSTEKYVEAKGIIEHCLWFLNIYGMFFLPTILFYRIKSYWELEEHP